MSEPVPGKILCTKARILIVDDNEGDRIILKAQLNRLGFHDIQEAEDGAMAEYKVNNAHQIQDPFDIVFVDWMMPRLDGLKLLQILRSKWSTRRLTIIMTTARAEPNYVREAMDAGVTDYIIKPHTLQVLTSKIAKYTSEESA